MEDLCFPQLINASCRKPQISHFQVVLMYFLLFISVLTVVLNLLIIISVSHFRQLHTPTNLLLLSLAVSDFITGLDLMLEVYRFTTCWFLGDILCSLHALMASLCLFASVGEMILISFDRYVAICDPLHYPTRVTVRRVKMCVCMWSPCSFIYYCLFYKSNLAQPARYRSFYGRCVISVNYISGIVDTVLSFFCSNHCDHNSVHESVSDGCVSTCRSVLGQDTGCCYTGVLFFCPIYCYTLVRISAFLQGKDGIPGVFGVSCTVLMYINPCLNPVIYALFYPWFRKSIRFSLFRSCSLVPVRPTCYKRTLCSD